MSSNMVFGLALAVFAIAMLTGCGTPAKDNSAEGDKKGTTESMEKANEKPPSAEDGGEADAKLTAARAELAKLPAEDVAAAEKQHKCPVSGELLGSMGVPIKVDVNGRSVWICCAGCKDALLEKPDEYLGKLPPE